MSNKVNKYSSNIAQLSSSPSTATALLATYQLCKKKKRKKEREREKERGTEQKRETNNRVGEAK